MVSTGSQVSAESVKAGDRDTSALFAKVSEASVFLNLTDPG